ncbi:MAG TPA: sigma-54 dependent transcriptional regulator [Longimicrobiales bacterium]|nr:sigma-54 dependent transcriptional regulator [Longimicrobiales bacterium]
MASGNDAPRVLLADDQPDVLTALKLLLADDGYKLETATTPPGVLKAIEERTFDAVVMDLNYTRDTTSGREGLTLLQCIRAADAATPVLVMTAWGSIEGAVEAMRHGANDYIEKPWNDERLRSTLRTQIELGRALRRSARLEAQNERLQRQGLPVLIGDSAAMRSLVQIMERVAPSDANVLITGEHGTGKDVVAQWLHSASHRSAKQLVTVNAGGLSEGVAESELFGHVKGAFTDARTERIGCFELADGGTLFLDEIANMSPKLQSKLLRVSQTGELQRVGSSRTIHVDVRVLSATNADILAEIEAGRFREDLLYRLNTVQIHLPPLRDRGEDVLLLAAHFLGTYATKYGRPVRGFDHAAQTALRLHSWPGNIRELAHAVERAVLLTPGDRITAQDLGLQARTDGAGAEDTTLEEAERTFIRKVLAKHGGNVMAAAEQLGMSRSALYRRIQHHGL